MHNHDNQERVIRIRMFTPKNIKSNEKTPEKNKLLRMVLGTYF